MGNNVMWRVKVGLNIPILWTYGCVELNGRFVWNNLGFEDEYTWVNKVTGVVSRPGS